MNLRELMDVYRGYRIPHFKIIEHKSWWFAFSGVLIGLSIIGFFWQGLNYSIDFEGGAQLTYPLKNDVAADEVSATLAEHGLVDAEVQIVTGDQPGVAARTESLSVADDRTALLEDLASQAGVTFDDINIEDVGPTWGAEISGKALRGLVFVLLAISAYIWIRFEWEMAIGAMIALVHDVVITVGIYALTSRQVTPETVIAVLTILGFSLYDTVVIYDKVKENTESAAMVAHYGYIGVVDRSLNQVLMRSVNTSLVVMLPILSLLLFGGETLKDFAFAMFVGTGIGAYSSIFIAAPILTLFHRKRAAPATARAAQARSARAAIQASTAGEEAMVSEAAATRTTARQGSSGRPRPTGSRRAPVKKKKRRR
jgi:preprotein translocase subunit SecF